jgi:hypothetical protein
VLESRNSKALPGSLGAQMSFPAKNTMGEALSVSYNKMLRNSAFPTTEQIYYLRFVRNTEASDWLYSYTAQRIIHEACQAS